MVGGTRPATSRDVTHVRFPKWPSTRKGQSANEGKRYHRQDLTWCSFCSFRGETILISVLPETERTVVVLRVGLFDGVEKSAHFEVSKREWTDADSLISFLSRDDAVRRSFLSSAIGPFVRISTADAYRHVVLPSLKMSRTSAYETPALQMFVRSCQHLSVARDEGHVENVVKRGNVRDTSEGFVAMCESEEQFGDLGLRDWTFPSNYMAPFLQIERIETRADISASHVDVVCKAIVRNDPSICDRLRLLIRFMRIYFEARGDEDVCAFMRVASAYMRNGGAILRAVVIRSIDAMFREERRERSSTPTQSVRVSQNHAARRSDRKIDEHEDGRRRAALVLLRYRYVIPARDALRSMSARPMVSASSPETRGLSVSSARRAYDDLRDDVEHLANESVRVSRRAFAAALRSITHKAKHVAVMCAQVAKMEASSLADFVWPWMRSDETTTTTMTARLGHHLTRACCVGDIGQVHVIVQYASSRKQLRDVLDYKWTSDDSARASSREEDCANAWPRVGNTALVEAVRWRYVQLARLLLRMGARTDVTDIDGRDVVDVARLEDPAFRLPVLPCLVNMVRVARVDGETTTTTSFARMERSYFKRTRLTRPSTSILPALRSASSQDVYMRRLAAGRSAHGVVSSTCTPKMSSRRGREEDVPCDVTTIASEASKALASCASRLANATTPDRDHERQQSVESRRRALMRLLRRRRRAQEIVAYANAFRTWHVFAAQRKARSERNDLERELREWKDRCASRERELNRLKSNESPKTKKRSVLSRVLRRWCVRE